MANLPLDANVLFMTRDGDEDAVRGAEDDENERTKRTNGAAHGPEGGLSGPPQTPPASG